MHGEGVRGPRESGAPAVRASVLGSLAACAATTAVLLARHRIRLPRTAVGLRVRFADGTSAPVYRETVVTGVPCADPCVLVVAFRLRLVRGRGHAAFRAESLLNTPLFVGFPGFASKLWLAHDERGTYRGIYEWDGPDRAEEYVRCLRRVLALVCVPGSVHHVVLPGARRPDVLPAAGAAEPVAATGPDGWWRPVGAERVAR
jgi:hypothetical protein